jgi:hypothetical protein
MAQGFAIDKRVPLALILTLFLQASMAVWWASSKETQDKFRDIRLDGIEQRMTGTGERQTEMLERLARLEAQGSETLSALHRIEARLARQK